MSSRLKEFDLILAQMKPVMPRSVEVKGMLFMLISFTCCPKAIICQNTKVYSLSWKSSTVCPKSVWKLIKSTDHLVTLIHHYSTVKLSYPIWSALWCSHSSIWAAKASRSSHDSEGNLAWSSLGWPGGRPSAPAGSAGWPVRSSFNHSPDRSTGISATGRWWQA